MADQKPTHAFTGEYLTEREAARERLKSSIDALTERANLQAQMQKEPLKMLGGASAVGAVLGLVMGRQLRRSKKIYVDAASPAKHQKALMKAQSARQSGKGVGNALLATVGTLVIKALTEKVITPKLEALSSNLLEKAGQPGADRSASRQSSFSAPSPTYSTVRPAPAPAAQDQPFVPSAATAQQAAVPSARPQTMPPAQGQSAAPTAPLGVRPLPESKVEAKAVGSTIAPDEKANPNLR